MIGLKSSWRKDQLSARLKFHPPLIELYLADGELENERKAIQEILAFLNSKKIITTIHQPHRYKELPLGIAYRDKKLVNNCFDCWSIISEMCEEFSLLGFIAHPYMFLKHEDEIDCKETLLKNLMVAKENWNYMFLENDGESLFANIEDIEWITSRTGNALKFCFDISHFYMRHRSNSQIKILSFKDRIKYLHISDSDGYVDGLEVGAGCIDFSILDDFDNIPGVIEVFSTDEQNPKEMLNSWKKILTKGGTIKNVN